MLILLLMFGLAVLVVLFVVNIVWVRIIILFSPIYLLIGLYLFIRQRRRRAALVAEEDARRQLQQELNEREYNAWKRARDNND